MNKTKLKKCLGLALLLSSTVCFADFLDGVEAYKTGDYSSAHKIWKELAEVKMTQESRQQMAEQADAQFALALLYWDGKGVKQDTSEAKKWLELAASQDQIDAQLKLGELYMSDLAGEPDFSEGIKWLERAATAGNIDAQYNLGLVYLRGIGVTIDANIAQKWLLLAEEQGDEEATLRLKEIDPKHIPAPPKSPEQLAAEALIRKDRLAKKPAAKPSEQKTENKPELKDKANVKTESPVAEQAKPVATSHKQKPEAEQKNKEPESPKSTAAKTPDAKPAAKPPRTNIVWRPHQAPEVKPAQSEDQKKQ